MTLEGIGPGTLVLVVGCLAAALAALFGVINGPETLGRRSGTAESVGS